MRCPRCGRRTFRDETICPKCGAPMPQRMTLEEAIKQEGDSDMSDKYSQQYESGKYAAASAEPADLPEIPEIPEFPDLKVPPEFSASTESDNMGFYGSYGDACNDTPMEDFKPFYAVESPVTPAAEPSVAPPPVEPNVTLPPAEEEEFKPLLPSETEEEGASDTFMPSFLSGEVDDDLVLPDLPPVDNSGFDDKKSMGYEVTVEIKHARAAMPNEKPLNQPIREEGQRTTHKPKEFTAVASGTVVKGGDLPPLKEGQMYVAVTPKQFRQLKARQFRGLGILATLCLVIISAFCIWSYSNSFTDPLIGRWNGNLQSAYLPIEALQQTNQDVIASTWEFSSSGSMYLNVTVNETPVSLNGTYSELKDDNGEPYLEVNITNPMDATSYTLRMYYTITGEVLQLNDMEGMNMEINLTKE